MTSTAVLLAVALVAGALILIACLLAVVLGLAVLLVRGAVRAARWALDRSRWNGRRAAAMRRHPSAWRPADTVVDLEAIARELEDELNDPATFRRLWLNEWTTPADPSTRSFAELEHAQRNGDALARAVDRMLDEPTELLPRAIDVTTYDDAEPVVLKLYPPAVPRGPVIPNNDAEDAEPCG